MSYDEASSLGVTLTYTTGRLSSSRSTYGGLPSPSFAQVFSYDTMGRVINNSQCTPTNNCSTNWMYPIAYTYDLGGSTLSKTDGAAVKISQTFNAASRLTAVTSSLADSAHPATLLSSVLYNSWGIAASDTLGNGLAEARVAAPRGWLQSLTVGPPGSPDYSFNITSFAPNGDILTATDSVNGNWAYAYDDFNRLLSASATGQAYTYDYDRFGNRWHQNGPHTMMLSFTGNNNRMDTYSYDAAGNTLNDGVHTYVYDGYGQLSTIDGGNTATFYYDADGRRVRKILGGSTTDFLYDLEGNPVSEMTGTGGILQRGEVYTEGHHLATYWNGTTFFNHADWLGTERARTPYPGGSACETVANLPFGDNEIDSGPCTGTSTHHFTGKERDGLAGLDNFGARYNSSSLGRFMSPDWSSFPTTTPYADFKNPQSLNAYSYAKNNPTSLTDPNGHCDVDKEHHWGWCLWHKLGFYQTNADIQRQADEDRAIFSKSHLLINGIPAGDWAKTATNQQVIAATRQFVLAVLNQSFGGQQIQTAAGFLTQWGWPGQQSYNEAKNLLNEPNTPEETVDRRDLLGKVPTKDEAIQMIEDAGGKVERIEEGHPPGGVSPHENPHINYTTASGVKGTIDIQP